MSAFLAAVFASVSEWLLSKLFSFVGEEIKTVEQNEAIKTKAQADQEIVENASTPDEVAQAASTIASDTFKQ